MVVDATSSHGRPDVAREPISALPHILGRIFVQRIIRVRLKKKVLQSDHNRVEIENWFPIFSKDVQAYIALKVDIWMINFLCALDLWGIMRIIVVDSEGELECTTLVHALVRCNGQSKVEKIAGIGKMGLHGRWQV